MTIIKLAHLVHYDKLLKKIRNLTEYEIYNFSKFLRKNKKLYKFISIKCNKSKLAGFIIFEKFIHGRFLSAPKPEGSLIHITILVLLTSFMWDFTKYDETYKVWGTDMRHCYVLSNISKLLYGRVIKKYIVDTNKCSPNTQKIAFEIKEKNLRRAKLYLINIYEYKLLLKDETLNTFLLIYNIQLFIEKNYKEMSNMHNKYTIMNLTNQTPIEYEYNDISNKQYANVIDTCLPLSIFMKNLLYYSAVQSQKMECIKLEKNIKNKIIKIIHVLNYFGIHKNIIHKII